MYPHVAQAVSRALQAPAKRDALGTVVQQGFVLSKRRLRIRQVPQTIVRRGPGGPFKDHRIHNTASDAFSFWGVLCEFFRQDTDVGFWQVEGWMPTGTPDYWNFCIDYGETPSGFRNVRIRRNYPPCEVLEWAGFEITSTPMLVAWRGGCEFVHIINERYGVDGLQEMLRQWNPHSTNALRS